MYLRHTCSLAIAALILVVAGRLPDWLPASSGFTTETTGTFEKSGKLPVGPLNLAPRPDYWSSWHGSDSHTGRIAIGPFIESDSVTLAVAGYPTHPEAGLFLENANGNRLDLIKSDPGEKWQLITIELPPDWKGVPVRLVAVDNATGFRGWLAVSAPIGSHLDGNLLRSLGAFSFNSALIALLFLPACAWIESRRLVPAHWLPLLSGAIVAAVGYGAFWAYFAHPVIGHLYCIAAVGAGLWRIVLLRRSGTASLGEWRHPVRFAIVLALVYLALFHLFPDQRGFHQLARDRYCEDLPGDNELPGHFAEMVLDGKRPVRIGTDWLTSDRPPLQTGWHLLTLPAARLVGIDFEAATGTSGMIFQLLWVFAAYGVLRQFALSPAWSICWIFVLSLNGFFLLNTVFVWPKLAAGAFVIGAFGLLPRSHDRDWRIQASIGLFAVLAWLAHGGAAFALLGMLPLVAMRVRLSDLGRWFAGAAVIGCLAVPWVAYQKYHAPPGNRLPKWHLAGQIAIDSRGTWETIKDAYKPLAAREILENKWRNLTTQFRGEFSHLTRFGETPGAHRRNYEFRYTRSALGWFTLGVIALAVAPLFARGAAMIADKWREHAVASGWIVLSYFVWCALMFTPGDAIIHQGPYSPLIALFVMLAIWLHALGAWTILLMAALQGIVLVFTWLPSNGGADEPLQPASLVTLAIAAGLFGMTLWRARHDGSDKVGESLKRPA